MNRTGKVTVEKRLESVAENAPAGRSDRGTDGQKSVYELDRQGFRRAFGVEILQLASRFMAAEWLEWVENMGEAGFDKADADFYLESAEVLVERWYERTFEHRIPGQARV